jgi:hypothetical protein
MWNPSSSLQWSTPGERLPPAAMIDFECLFLSGERAPGHVQTHDAKLEIAFEGEVKRLLARFVTPVDG